MRRVYRTPLGPGPTGRFVDRQDSAGKGTFYRTVRIPLAFAKLRGLTRALRRAMLELGLRRRRCSRGSVLLGTAARNLPEQRRSLRGEIAIVGHSISGLIPIGHQRTGRAAEYDHVLEALACHRHEAVLLEKGRHLQKLSTLSLRSAGQGVAECYAIWLPRGGFALVECLLALLSLPLLTSTKTAGPVNPGGWRGGKRAFGLAGRVSACIGPANDGGGGPTGSTPLPRAQPAVVRAMSGRHHCRPKLEALEASIA